MNQEERKTIYELNELHKLKDTCFSVAKDLLLQYKALGLQYGRTIENKRQQEEYFIFLGRKIDDFEKRLMESME